MSTKKPVIFMPQHLKSYQGMIQEADEIIQEHFDVITAEDLGKAPESGLQAVGVIFFAPQLNILLENLDKLPNVKLAHSIGVGVDRLHSYWDEFWRRGIRVARGVGPQNKGLADMVFTLMTGAARNIVTGHDLVTAKTTTSSIFSQAPLGTELLGGTLGILGMGGIGFEVAKRARAFGMKVLYHNRHKRSTEDENLVGARFCADLHEMLRESDFLVISCIMTDATKHILSTNEFDVMKNNLIIVNIARGLIIDNNALVEALQIGKIRGVAMDVTSPEPLPRDHPLLSMSNVIITPHMSPRTRNTRIQMISHAAINVKLGLEGKAIKGEITKQTVHLFV